MNDTQGMVFAALADPVRRQLLLTLAENGTKTATQLTQDFPITRQGITKHLEVLQAAGLVEAQAAGREKRYTLHPEPLHDVSAWITTLGAVWDARLRRLKAIVEE